MLWWEFTSESACTLCTLLHVQHIPTSSPEVDILEQACYLLCHVVWNGRDAEFDDMMDQHSR